MILLCKDNQNDIVMQRQPKIPKNYFLGVHVAPLIKLLQPDLEFYDGIMPSSTISIQHLSDLVRCSARPDLIHQFAI
jgi:hypothetical protein